MGMSDNSKCEHCGQDEGNASPLCGGIFTHNHSFPATSSDGVCKIDSLEMALSTLVGITNMADDKHIIEMAEQCYLFFANPATSSDGPKSSEYERLGEKRAFWAAFEIARMNPDCNDIKRY
jgi:hypothetical protein